MGDDVRAALGLIIAPPTAGLSIYSLAEQIQPVVSVIGALVGIFVSVLAGAYYIKRLKEK